jgi:hypothetical protein
LPSCHNNQKEAGGFESKDKIGSGKRHQQPPNAGPIIPRDVELQTAQSRSRGNSASETIWGTIDVQAGPLIANPTPIKNTRPRMRQGLSRCSQPSSAKAKVVATKQTLTVHTSFWRFTLSASAPAGSVNKKNGRDATVDINDSKNGDPVKYSSSRSLHYRGPPHRFRRSLRQSEFF